MIGIFFATEPQHVKELQTCFKFFVFSAKNRVSIARKVRFIVAEMKTSKPKRHWFKIKTSEKVT